MLYWSHLRSLAGMLWHSAIGPQEEDDAVRLVIEPLEDRRVLSAVAALDTTTHQLTITGDSTSDNVTVQDNGDGSISILNGSNAIDITGNPNSGDLTVLSLDQVSSIHVDLGAGNDVLHLPVLHDDTAGFTITVVDGDGTDQIHVSENTDTTYSNPPILDLAAEQIHFGGDLGTNYDASDVTLHGDVILDGSVSVATHGGEFNASAATLYASVQNADFSLDGGGGTATFGLVQHPSGTAYYDVAHLDVVNHTDDVMNHPGDVVFDKVVSVGTLSVDAQKITIHDDVSTGVGVTTAGDGGISLESVDLLTVDRATGNQALTVDTHGHDLTLISGVVGSSPFVIGKEVSFLSTHTSGSGGTVTIGPSDSATPIEIGTPTTSDMSALWLHDVGLFSHFDFVAPNAFDGLTIGSDAQSGQIGVFADPNIGGHLHLNAGMGSVLINNDITAGSLTVDGAAVLGTDAVITTSGTTAFNGTVNSQTDAMTGLSEANDLTVSAGAGDVTFSGAVGTGANGELGAVIVNSSGVTLFGGAVKAASLTTDLGGGLNERTELNGDVTTTGAQIYHDDVRIDTGLTLATTNSAVTFDQTVNSQTDEVTGLTEANALTVSSGSGGITFSGAVGGATNGELGAILVNSSGVTRFNSTVEAASLTTNVGGTTQLNGDVTTTGAQTYHDDVIIDASLTLATTNSAVTFDMTVNSQVRESNSLTVNAGTGTTLFGGQVGGVVALASLTTDAGGTTELNGNVTTTGAQTYHDDVLIDSGLTLAGSAVTFDKTVNSQSGENNALSVNASGTTLFSGAVGAVDALASLTTDAAGTTELNGNVRTIGAQTYHDNVLIDSGLTLAGSAVTFDKTVNSQSGENNALTVNATGTTLFSGAVGEVDTLASLTTDAAGTTELNGNVTTSGAQTYHDDVLIDTGLTLVGSAVTFDKTVNSQSGENNALTVNASGTTLFGGEVGGVDALASLTTDAAGTTELNGNVTTTGAQTYHDDVLIDSDLTLAGSAVTFDKTVNSQSGENNALTVNASGTTLFSGAVGGVDTLASLTTDAAGTTELNGNVTTTGAQTYHDNVLIDSDLTLTGSAVTFDKTVNSQSGENNALTVNASGTTLFSGAVGGVDALANLTTDAAGTTELNGNVTTTGAQIFHDDVLIDSGLTLAGSAVTFDKTVNSQSGENNALTVNASGTTLFGGAVGGVDALASLTTDAAGTTELNGNVTTTGAQTYHDDVLIDSGLALAGSAVTFDKTVNSQSGENNALTVDASGTTLFSGEVGGVDALASLTTDAAGTTELNGNVTTTGAQTYHDNVLIDSGLTLAGSTVTFDGTVNSQKGENNALTVNASGTTYFGGAVGGVDALASLTTDAAGTTELNGNVTTTGAQTYHDDVLIDSGLTLVTTDSAVTFDKTVNSQADGVTGLSEANDLTISSGSGDVTFSGAVGAATSGDLGAVTINSAHNVSIQSTFDAGSLLQTAGTGTTTIGGATTLATGLDLTTASIVINGNVDVQSGIISLVATTGNVQINADLTTSGDVNVTAAKGAVSMQNPSLIDSGSGTITILADQTVTLGELSTSNATTDAVHVTSTTGDILLQQQITTAAAGGVTLAAPKGSILDENDGSTLITTGDLWLLAGLNIGQIDDFAAGTGNAIDVDLSGTLRQAVATGTGVAGTGDIFLNVAGDLTADAGSIDPGSNVVGRALIETGGDLDLTTVAGIIVLDSGDSLGLQAGGTLTVPDTGLDVGTGDLRLAGLDVVTLDPISGTISRDLGPFVANTLGFTSGTDLATTLNTEVNTLVAEMTGAGSLTVNEADGIQIQSIVMNGGDVTVNAAQSAAGDLSIVQVNAGSGQVVLDVTAQGGAIVDASDAETDIIAGAVALRATDGIADNNTLEIDAGTLAATTVTGDINILNVGGDLIIGTVDGTVGVGLSAGAAGDDLSIATSGALLVHEAISNAGAGNVTLMGADVSVGADVSSVGGAINISADNGVVLGAAGSVTSTSGAVDVTATAGAIAMADGSVINAGSGAVGLIADGDVGLGLVETTSDVTVTSANGAIVDAALNGTPNIVANHADLQAAGDISINTQITSIVADTTSGDVMISEVDGLLVQSVQSNNGDVTISAATGGGTGDIGVILVDAGTGQVVLNTQKGSIVDADLRTDDTDVVGGAVALRATSGIGVGNAIEIDAATLAATTVTGDINIVDVSGDLAVGTVAGTVGVNITGGAAGDDVSLSTPGMLTVLENVSNAGAGDVTLAAGDVAIGADVSSVGGAINISADNGVVLGAAGSVTSTSGAVNVTATAGAIAMADGSVINAGSGNVVLQAADDVTLGLVETTTSVSVTSTTGGIVDGGDIGVFDIKAGSLGLAAQTGIGSGDPLELSVNLLSATNGSLGDIQLSNDVNGPLTIGAVGRSVGVTNTGNIWIQNDGPMTVAAPVTSTSGDVTLTSLTAAGDLTIKGQVSADGAVVLNAGGDLTINDAGTTNDVVGDTVTGNAGGSVMFGNDVIVRSSTGAVTQPKITLDPKDPNQILADPISSLGEAVIHVTIPDSPPGAENFTITVDFSGVHTETVTGVDPGQERQFSYTFTMNPNDPDSATGVAITVTVTDDSRITFTAGGQEQVPDPVTAVAAAPATGWMYGFVLDLSVQVPQPQVQSQPVSESVVVPTVIVYNQTEEIEAPPPTAQQAVEKIVVVTVEKLGPDGNVELTPDGKPIRRTYQGDDAEAILENRLELFEALRSGHFRAWLQEGAHGIRRLLWDEVLRNGRPSEGSEGTRDRPPTESGDQVHPDHGESGDALMLELPHTDHAPGHSPQQGEAADPAATASHTDGAHSATEASTTPGQVAPHADAPMAAAILAPSWIPLAARGRRVWRRVLTKLADAVRVSSH